MVCWSGNPGIFNADEVSLQMVESSFFLLENVEEEEEEEEGEEEVYLPNILSISEQRNRIHSGGLPVRAKAHQR